MPNKASSPSRAGPVGGASSRGQPRSGTARSARKRTASRPTREDVGKARASGRTQEAHSGDILESLPAGSAIGAGMGPGRIEIPSGSPPVSAERAAELRQEEQFSKAAGLFQARKFAMARRILEKVQFGPNASLGHRARVYLEICRKKSARKRPKLETVEDHYNYAVRLVNDRELPEAQRVLNRGLALDAGTAHLHYLKAVAKTLAGDHLGAAAPLRKAIELDPKIRILAQGDPDLQSVISREPFASLLSGRDS